MRFLLALFLFMFSTPLQWGNNYEQALLNAQKGHKYILLNFSGSDWCGPCIRLHKEVFTTDAFIQLANDKLVLLNADFPRYKKNKLTAAQQKINDALADKYNNKGVFPLTVLLNAEGKIIKSWEGFPADITDFIEDVQQTILDNK